MPSIFSPSRRNSVAGRPVFRRRFERLLQGLGSAAGSLIGFAPCVDRLDAHADFSAQVAQSFPLPDVVVKELRGRHGAGNRTHDAEKAPANVHQNLR